MYHIYQIRLKLISVQNVNDFAKCKKDMKLIKRILDVNKDERLSVVRKKYDLTISDEELKNEVISCLADVDLVERIIYNILKKSEDMLTNIRIFEYMCIN